MAPLCAVGKEREGGVGGPFTCHTQLGFQFVKQKQRREEERRKRRRRQKQEQSLAVGRSLSSHDKAFVCLRVRFSGTESMLFFSRETKQLIAVLFCKTVFKFFHNKFQEV